MDKYFTCSEPRYFSFAEMTRTDTGIDNRPTTWEQVENLMVTANRLDTVRGKFGKAVRVNCAFRSEAVNARVGGRSDVGTYERSSRGHLRIRRHGNG